MHEAQYFIIPHNGAWMVKSDQGESGPYPSHADALLVATNTAKTLSERGISAKVVWTGTIGDNGRFHHEWVYNRSARTPFNPAHPNA